MTQEQPQLVPLELRTFVELLYAVRECHDNFSREIKQIPSRDLKQVFVGPSMQGLVFSLRFFERYATRAPGERLWGLPRNFSPYYTIGKKVAFADMPKDKQEAFSSFRNDDSVKYVLTGAGTYRRLKQDDILITFEDIGGIENLVDSY